MALHKADKLSHLYIFLSSLSLLCTHTYLRADLTSLAKNDANPPFSTLGFDESWLLTKEQLQYKQLPDADKKKNRFNFSISPFAQNADLGKPIQGQLIRRCSPNNISILNSDVCPSTVNALGDLTGRSSMIALLFGSFPAEANNEYPGGKDGYLQTAFEQLFGGTDTLPGHMNDEKYIDEAQLFGYFSFPLNYRKRGVRFECALRVYQDFLIRVQAGISSIRQVIENTYDLTLEYDPSTGEPYTFEGLSGAAVDQYLMDEVDNIAEQMKLDIGNQNQASVEEVRINACWRHAFEINKDETSEWAQFLLIPYFEVSGSISPGEERKPNQLFAAPFGNNGHASTGCTAGINFDFYKTIEIGGEVGFTHFFKKSFCNYPVPNSQFQTTMFPFQTNVSIQPGNNWHFCAHIAAYHFVDNLSMHFEWFVVDHKQDKICLETPDPAFLPKVLEKTTTFKTKMGNLGLNYDASPNIGIGFLWQIPFSQRNTYRSSTVMAGINITF